MSTTQAFAYNPSGIPIDGTLQSGDFALGEPTSGYTNSPQFWNGPDEDLGYVIAQPVPAGNQPNPVGGSAYLGFFRTDGFSDLSFVELSSAIADIPFSNSQEAYDWLTTNGYYTTFNLTTPTPTPTQTSTVTPTETSTQTPTTTSTNTPTVTNTPTSSTTPTPTPSGGIVTSNLIMELDASNYTSGTWTDETGNGNNGTVNGATWSATNGGIFDFDGVNDTISIAHNSSLSLSTTVQKTIQVWVKFDALPALNAQMPVFGKLSSNFGFDGYWGGLNSNGGVVRVVTNGTSIQRISNSTSTISIDNWYLFTFISQITATANTTKVYINTTEYITTAHGSDSYSESNPLYLGFIGTGISSLYLNGKIGAAYFYTKGLTSAEVTQNFDATKSKYGL